MSGVDQTHDPALTGALFEPESGRCVGGPCAGQRLTRWPVTVSDGMLFTA